MTMHKTCSRWFAIAVTGITVAGSVPAQQQPRVPPKYHASPLHVAQLPKYCWQQYVDGSLTGYEFTIVSQSCGYEMNHFCPALVFMMEAQSLTLPMSERRGAMNNAIKEINYTLRGMKPGCHVANDVLAAQQRAQALSMFIK